MVIRAEDRLSEVLSRDPRMVEIITTAAPSLRGLNNPVTRRIMGRLATMEQVARIAGIEPDLLLYRVNRAMGQGEDETGREIEVAPVERDGGAAAPTTMPGHLREVPPHRILDLDVREDLRHGREPFSRIMKARKQLRAGGVLRLRATFEPAPLYRVMAAQGYAHWTEQLADDDWRVWFYAEPNPPSSGARGEPPPGAARPSGEDTEDQPADVVILDVRGLEPPEPMVRTLAALETLPRGKTLLQINERIPQFLLPRLEELGFDHEIREQAEGVVRVFIRHA